MSACKNAVATSTCPMVYPAGSGDMIARLTAAKPTT